MIHNGKEPEAQAWIHHCFLGLMSPSNPVSPVISSLGLSTLLKRQHYREVLRVRMSLTSPVTHSVPIGVVCRARSNGIEVPSAIARRNELAVVVFEALLHD